MRHATILASALLLAAASFAAAQPAEKPSAPSAPKQTQESPSPKSCPDCSVRTFYLKYATQPAEMNEIASALRQLLQDARIFVIPSQDAIMVRTTPEDMALTERVLGDLDRPKKAWHLTYTITEMDGDKRVGTQHYSMDLVDGQRTDLKQGSKVPISGGQHGDVVTAFTYQDIGITFTATLVSEGPGARLQSDIEQNSVADQSSTADASYHPVITRNSSLRGAYLLTLNKPLVLGAMDIPGSTHHLEIEALIEPLP